MSNRNSFPTRTKKIYLFFLLGLLITGFITCKGKKEDEKASSASALAGFQMNCVRLERSQIQEWVDSGWTNPATPSTLMKKILLQFYTADATNASTNMQLISYPGKSYTDVYTNGLKYLSIDTTCTPLMLSGPISLSNNYINFANLDITMPDGSLKAFDFIRLRPIKKYPPYLNFEIEVVQIVAAKETILKKDGSDPCPTICP